MALEEYEPYRPSDFIVHEIDVDENEADQFNTEIPPLPESGSDFQKAPTRLSKRLLVGLNFIYSSG